MIGAMAIGLICMTAGGVLAADVQGTGAPRSAGTVSGTGAPFGVSETLKNPIKYDTFSQLAEAVIKTAVEVLMPFLIIAIIYIGFLFVKAQGNESAITDAKNKLFYTIIGAAILMGAWGFAQLIGNTITTITQ